MFRLKSPGNGGVSQPGLSHFQGSGTATKKSRAGPQVLSLSAFLSGDHDQIAAGARGAGHETNHTD